MLSRVSRAVIHRLNYPKRVAARMSRHASLSAKIRPLLSQWDCEEVHQTCALILHSSGALSSDTSQLADWIACFRAARAVLRIDRGAHEDATDVLSPMSDLRSDHCVLCRALLAPLAKYGPADFQK